MAATGGAVMPATVQVQIDKAQLRKVQRALADYPKQIPKVMYRAVNRTAKPARTKISKEIRRDVNITAKDLKRYLSYDKATRYRWAATIGISGKRIPLMKFKGTKELKRGGVSYKVRGSGAREKVPDGFIATMPTGHTGVFKRKTEKWLPIVELYGPSLGYAFENAAALAARVTAEAYDDLERHIDDQIRYMLEKKRSAG